MTDFVQAHPDGVVLAMDEMSLYFQATTTRVWWPVGQTPEVYVSGSREHVHFVGALNLRTGFQLALPTPVQSVQTIQLFLADLLRVYPSQPILLLLDNAPWHKAHAIAEFVRDHPRLHCLYFPPACPHLNPQEHVWSQARAAVSHNHTFRQFSALKDAFLHFLSSTRFPISSSFMPPLLPPLFPASLN